MKNIFRKIVKNKVFYVFLFLTILLFPGTLYKIAQSESRAILTAIGIDKIEDQLEVSASVVTPGGGTKYSDNLKLVTAKGNSISQCFESISSTLGKSVGLAHAELIVLGKEIIQENAFEYLNYFISTNNLTTNAVIVTADNAKEILDIDINNPTLANITAKQIVQYDSKFHQSIQTNLDKFFLEYFSQSGISLLPKLEVVDQSQENQDSSGSSPSNDSGNNQSSESSQGGEKQSESKNKIIENNGNMVVLKKGKFVTEFDSEKNEFFYMLHNPKNKGIFTVENITDKNVNDASVVLEVVRKRTYMKPFFIDGKPFIYCNLFLVLKLDEYVVDSENIDTIDSTNSKITNEIKDSIESKIKTKVSQLIQFSKDNNIDIFNFYKTLNAYENKNFKEYMKNHDMENYLEDINFAMDITIRGKI